MVPDAREVDPATKIQHEELHALIVDAVMKNATDLEAASLLEKLQGRSYAQAAQNLGKTTKQVDHALQRAQAKLLRNLRAEPDLRALLTR